MTARITTETFLAAFAELERRDMAGSPSWLRDLRRASIARFADRGLPSPRDEEWKYTSLAPLVATPFELAVAEVGDEIAEAGDKIAEETIASLGPGPASWSSLVFVNGRYSAKVSSIRPLPGGVRLASLAEAVITDAERVRPYLTMVPEEPGDAFAALNAAFWQDGAFLHLPPGAALEEPVLLLFVATSPGTAWIGYPRSLVVLERESRATVVELYVALAADAYLTNAVTDLVLAAGAEIDHHKVTLEGPRGFHVGRTRVRQERDSRCVSCSVTFGGRLVRNNVHALLGAAAALTSAEGALGSAAGAECSLSGLYVIGGAQHVDIHTVVDHQAPRATSRQLYKGVLDGRARGVFSGRIVVRPGANGTDAYQMNKNLLLADGVEVDSKPQLEIFADDVKCSHGAADGQPATDALFYLKSRGLDEAAARALLTYGFAREVLERIRVEPIRAWLDGLLTARLSGGRVAEEQP